MLGSTLRFWQRIFRPRCSPTEKRGRYGARKVSEVPAEMRAKYFHVDPHNSDILQIHDEFREMVTFNRLNLIKPPYPMSGKFDGILCRNVMIYFDQETGKRLPSA